MATVSTELNFSIFAFLVSLGYLIKKCHSKKSDSTKNGKYEQNMYQLKPQSQAFLPLFAFFCQIRPCRPLLKIVLGISITFFRPNIVLIV